MVRVQRDPRVDTIRGLTCLLLVAYHVIGESGDNGLHVAPDSFWRYFADSFIFFRMPMFAFIAGHIYACRPFAGDAKRFLIGKARRLLVPMLILGNVFAYIEYVIHHTGPNGAQSHWAVIHILPVAHYWFLGSLFVIFAVTAILESLRLLNDWRSLAIVLAVATAIYLTMDPFYFADSRYFDLYFDLARTVYLFPYFLCGLASARFPIDHSRLYPIAVGIFIASWIYAAAGVLGLVPYSERVSFVALLVGISGGYVLLRSGWTNAALAFIGLYAYAIYLFHIFFTAPARMLLMAFHVTDLGALFFTGLLAGIVFPILIEIGAQSIVDAMPATAPRS